MDLNQPFFVVGLVTVLGILHVLLWFFNRRQYDVWEDKSPLHWGRSEDRRYRHWRRREFIPWPFRNPFLLRYEREDDKNKDIHLNEYLHSLLSALWVILFPVSALFHFLFYFVFVSGGAPAEGQGGGKTLRRNFARGLISLVLFGYLYNILWGIYQYVHNDIKKITDYQQLLPLLYLPANWVAQLGLHSWVYWLLAFLLALILMWSVPIRPPSVGWLSSKLSNPILWKRRSRAKADEDIRHWNP